MKYIAFTTKGLEEIARLEIEQRFEEVSIDEIGDKRVIFSLNNSLDKLLDLRTVDDLGIFAGKVEVTRDAEQIGLFISDLDLFDLRNKLCEFREVIPNTFSLTVGTSSTNIKSSKVIDSAKESITNKYGWDYVEFDHSSFDIRVFIDHKTAYISVRLTRDSLYNRFYKLNSKPGSLKPTIAAAMVILATNFQENLRVVDNFCGSGTILCEAFIAGNQVFGADFDPESVQITQSNLSNLGYAVEDKIKVLDARKTNWTDNQFDCAISNLPWDKQIEVTSITDLYEGSIRECVRILKKDGILCALISKPELYIKYAKMYRPEAKIVSRKIGLLGQNPTIVLVS